MPNKGTIRVDAASLDYLLIRRGGQKTGAGVSPGRVTITGVERLAYDYVVEVELDSSGRGRVVVPSLTASAREGGPDVTSRRLGREVGEAKWIAVSALSAHVDESGRTRPFSRGLSPTDVRSAMAGKSSGPAPVPAPELERAAEVYREAAAAGRPRTAAVARALRVSESTARKRVFAARKKGLLLPTVKGTTRPKREDVC